MYGIGGIIQLFVYGKPIGIAAHIILAILRLFQMLQRAHAIAVQADQAAVQAPHAVG
jgi:hypothetical protein